MRHRGELDLGPQGAVLSHFSRVRLLQPIVAPWTVALQAPLSIGFSRQEYWSGLPFPTSDLPDPGIKPASFVYSALQVDSLLSPRKPQVLYYVNNRNLT